MRARILIFMILLCAPVFAFAEPGTVASVHGAHGVVFGEYQLKIASEPAVVEAGQPVRLDLSVRSPEGEVVEAFSSGEFELGLARDGLDVFAALRPTRAAGGVFTSTLKFPVPGTYFCYLTFSPQDSGSVTVMGQLVVAGTPPAPLPLEVHVPGRILSETLGADITLEKLAVGYRIGLSLLGPDGGELQDLDSTTGDLVILSADGREYFHAQHVPGNGTVQAVFETRFPAPGLYKAWALFSRGGKKCDLPFALQISAP